MTDFEVNFNFENREPIELEATIEPRPEIDAQFVINAHTAVATWGSITGLLSNQTDLQNALDEKADKATTINGYPLNDNISLKTSDLTNDSGYITLEDISSNATGLSYDNTTGVFSLENGYEIPSSETLNTYITKDVDNLTYYRKSTTQDIIDNELSSRITNEVTARTNADNQLSNRINTETTNRNNADIALQQNIDTETLARSNADTLLSNRIASNQQAIGTEAQRRISADAILQSNIDAEIADREVSESNLSNRIDTNEENISAEVIARTNAINALNQAISQEVLDRTSGDSALQEEIDDLSSNLTSHIEDTDNPHNVTKAQIGLSNVDNTSDLNKPISTATQNALNQKATISSVQSLADRVEDIENIMPTEATTSNKLADKNYVDISIGRGNLTIQKNNANVGIFNANSSANKTINIEVPTKTSDLTNDAGFIDLTDISSGSEALTYNNDTGVISITPGYSITTSIQRNQIEVNTNNISDIQELIPNQASSSNQLADKDFVNSTIQTGTANFRGNWDTWADVPLYPSEYPEDYSGSRTPDTNDYMVIENSSDYAPLYSNERPYPVDFCVYYNDILYKSLEEISIPEDFNPSKWEEVTTGSYVGTWRFKYVGVWSSVAREGWKPEYRVNEEPFTIDEWKAIKSGITSDDVTLIHSAIQPGDNVSELVNDAEYIDKDVNNLTYYTTTSNLNTLLADKQDVISDLETIRSGASAGATAVQPEDLATVATTGSYTDLTNQPDINNGTLTIQANGTTVATFTANQSTDTIADITIPDSATWGNISGTLSNQTDLQTALNGKADKIEAVSSGGSIGQVFVKKSDTNYDTEWQSADDLRMFNKDAFTVVGSPNITDDGIASGFSTSNYLTKEISITDNDLLKIDISFLYSNLTSQVQRVLTFGTSNLRLIEEGDAAVSVWISVATSVGYATKEQLGNPIAGDRIRTIIELSSTESKVTFFVNGIQKYTLTKTNQAFLLASSKIYIGSTGSSEYWQGSIDLKQFSITVDGVELFNGSIPLAERLGQKQNTLVSGTNIKTVNNNSLLGSGNINIDSLPSQSGQSGKFLTTNGSTASWATISIPVIDSALDSTSTNPVENRVIAQALEEISLAKNPNLNIIGGNLNIDNGNVSGFSTTDYMQFPFVFNFNGYHWTLEMGFTTGSDVTTQQNILDSYYGIAFAIRNGKFVLAISSNGSSWDIANTEGTYSVQANTAYSVKIAWDGTNYTLSYALDETNYTTDITEASALVHHPTQEYVGGEPDLYGSGQHPFGGTINLNNWNLIVNFLEVWLGMDDVGLGSRANIDLSNLTEAGQYMVDTVKDQNGGDRLKYWTGTRAQYDVIVSKDSTTVYFLTDSGKIYFGDTLISSVGNNVLFDFKWSDHQLNNISWLRADTFSWQSGDVYTSAYNHLVADLQGTTAETETIGSYTVTFYRATDGHKIVTADQEQTVLNIYNESGIAWYYIIDTTNTQFKFPRTKYGFEGLRTNVGDKIDESLPNITATARGSIRADINGISGAFTSGWTEGTSYQYNNGLLGTTNSFGFDASRSSSTYQNNAPVQERATQMYLYFYVGDYSQTAIEQTAGINSELFNGKADVDLTNINNSGTSKGAGWTMPSRVFKELTLGATGTQYVAPATGWFYIDKRLGNTLEYFGFINTSRSDCSQYFAPSGMNNVIGLFPVQSGDVVKLNYNVSGITNHFRFYYAQGSESEAN